MARRTKKKALPKRSVKRPKRAKAARRPAGKKRTKRATVAARAKGKLKAKTKAKAKAAPRRRKAQAPPRKAVRLDRVRRTLDEVIVQTPPSSLDMVRRGSAARSGRAEMLDQLEKNAGMNSVTAGDVDVNAEDAYFTGEESPGGDNPTPDQDRVDDIGKALGVQYQDDEELKGADKVAERDKHRWELDPASSEDYKGRK